HPRIQRRDQWSHAPTPAKADIAEGVRTYLRSRFRVVECTASVLKLLDDPIAIGPCHIGPRVLPPIVPFIATVEHRSHYGAPAHHQIIQLGERHVVARPHANGARSGPENYQG